MDSKLKAGLAAVAAILIALAAGALLLDESKPAPGPGGGPGPLGSRASDPRVAVSAPPRHGGTPAPGATPRATRPKGPAPSPSRRVGPGGERRPDGPQGGGSAQGPLALAVICEDGQGHPLPGVRLEARRRSGMPLSPAYSDSEGRASLGGLPEGETIQGVARHPRVEGGVAFGPVRIEPGASLRVRLNLARLGRLQGKILDTDGRPIREAEVILVNPREGEGEAILDTAALGLTPDGSFVTEVAAGSYAVSARGRGFSESDRVYVTVPPDADASPIELRVVRQATISGRVQLPPDVVQLRPLELDVVIESESGTERNPLTRTERRRLQPAADLTFTLQDCHAGRVRIRLELPQTGDHRVGPWSSLALAPGQDARGILLSLAEVTISVSGSVRDDRGAVIPNVVVSVRSRKVTTDLQGHFVIRGLDMGESGLEASLPGYAKGYRAIDYQGSPLEVDLVLARFGEVAGTVEGAGAGIPVILIRNQDGAVETINGTTTGAGQFVIKDVPPGTYQLKAGKGADPFDTAGAPSVTVQPGEQAKAPPLQQ